MSIIATLLRRRIGLLLLAYIAFISLGLPDGLLGVAWPTMRADFGRPLDSLGLLIVASTLGYLTSSFFSGRIMARLGVGGLLAASCALTGGALLGYTVAPMWWVMLPLGLIAGFGAGAIDAGINTYVASHYGENLMQWLHASFGIGITLGPIIMTTGLNAFDSWRIGYLIVGVAQLTLAAVFAVTRGLWQNGGTQAAADEAPKLTDYKTPLGDTLRRARTWFSAALFFIYTGVEISLGLWAYSLLTESRGVAPETAGLWTSSYWAMFTLGRILAGLYARRISSARLVQYSLFGALAGALLLWLNPFPISGVVAVAIVGLSIAPIFPALVSGTSSRVGAAHAANTIGIQISAAGLGGALLPTFAGTLGRHISLEAIPIYLTALIILLMTIHWRLTR